MYLALRKCKSDCKILTIILVPDFCPLKPEITRFSIGFRLNHSAVSECLPVCARVDCTLRVLPIGVEPVTSCTPFFSHIRYLTIIKYRKLLI